MKVEFRRTGERRYAITIFRDGYPTIEMNPAPGYDPVMPHDLLHLVVEKELGLRRGVFGQIAAGGNAGTFQIVPEAKEDKREAARGRRRASKRGDKLLREGRADSALSERVAYISFYEWLSRSEDPDRRKPSDPLAAERDLLTSEVLDRICASLDAASASWAALEIGESLTMTWGLP